jgi:hypothetical protein
MPASTIAGNLPNPGGIYYWSLMFRSRSGMRQSILSFATKPNTNSWRNSNLP